MRTLSRPRDDAEPGLAPAGGDGPGRGLTRRPGAGGDSELDCRDNATEMGREWRFHAAPAHDVSHGRPCLRPAAWHGAAVTRTVRLGVRHGIECRPGNPMTGWVPRAGGQTASRVALT